MNLNLGIATAATHLAGAASFSGDEPGCGTRVPGFHPPRGLEGLLQGIASLDDGEPGCGTPVPGHHPPPPPPGLALALGGSALDQVALNPQPLPPGEGISAGAVNSFTDDGQCGNVPLKVPHWPPPPPPWASLDVSSLPAVSGLAANVSLERSL